ncbi:IS110 family transposase [Nocardia sp. CWNU-33]|uniref:IS110 family transposase n=1 Tax=Nocardia sp. CWNU-33 TaxID=3392117 RepID=UPI00398E5CE7
MFAGWDWGTLTHDVTVIDDAGGKVERFAVPHTEAGIATAMQRLACHGDPARLPVTIETTRGLVVDRLWRPGIRSSRCIPTLSMPPGHDGRRQGEERSG